jgi:hypothetical protein
MRNIIGLIFGAASALTATFLFNLPALASEYIVTGDITPYGTSSVDPFTAIFSLDVSGGHAISGTGTISGGGLTSPETLTLITLSSPGVENDGGGLLGYRSNDGTDWYDADTAVPIDANGLIFAIGPGSVGFETSQQFDIYNNGNNTFDVGFFGKNEPGIAPNYYSYNIPVNVTVTPLPSAWTMLIAGFIGLVGFVAYGEKKRHAAATADA